MIFGQNRKTDTSPGPPKEAVKTKVGEVKRRRKKNGCSAPCRDPTAAILETSRPSSGLLNCTEKETNVTSNTKYPKRHSFHQSLRV